MKIGIASDHAGYELKEILKEELTILGYQTEDFGTNSPASMDYPDVAHPLQKLLKMEICHWELQFVVQGMV